MEKNHQLMGGDVQLFKRQNSQFWYCQASVGGRRHRISTKKESLKLAEDVAKDWFLTLQGKARAGLLTSERTFADAAKKFMAEYETITKGRRSPKWVAGHEARLRLHLLHFFGDTGLSKISPGMVQDYRVHRIKIGTNQRGGHRRRQALPDQVPSGTAAKQEKRSKVPKSAQGQERPVKPPATSTLHDEIVTLNLALKTAVRHGWLSTLPDVSAPYAAQTKIVHRPWFSPEEYKLLYETSRENARHPGQRQYQWHAEQLHDFILFMGNTGLRPDEAGHLQHRDVTIAVDHATGEKILEIEVRGKRGVGYCKSMPGAVRPYERLLNRPKPTRGKQPRNRSKKNPNPLLAVELPQPTDAVFPQRHAKMFNELLVKKQLKFDRDGKPRTAYSLRHTYICLRLMEGADIYQVAKNCRTSVEMIEKHYAAHIKNTIDASAINVMRTKAVRAMERQARNGGQQAEKAGAKLSRPERVAQKDKLRDAVRVPSADLTPGDLTAET
jgi:integrase